MRLLLLVNLIMVYLAFLPVSAYSQMVHWKEQFVMKDKQNVAYSFMTSYHIRHGVAGIVYALEKDGGQYIVFKGKNFGEAGDCPGEEASKHTIMAKAIIKDKYWIGDKNLDGYDDLIIAYDEKDCRTQYVESKRIIYLATDSGFQLFNEGEE